MEISMKKNKILVVDDDDFVRQSLTELLKLWKFEVAEAANIVEALKHIKDNHIAAILLDIKLGNESGLDLLMNIRAQKSNIPVIVMTAYPNDYNPNHFFSENAMAFLTKPIKIDRLKEVLITCLNKPKNSKEMTSCL
jgi:DNA-binding NtrC family response regulator